MTELAIRFLGTKTRLNSSCCFIFQHDRFRGQRHQQCSRSKLQRDFHARDGLLKHVTHSRLGFPQSNGALCNMISMEVQKYLDLFSKQLWNVSPNTSSDCDIQAVADALKTATPLQYLVPTELPSSSALNADTCRSHQSWPGYHVPLLPHLTTAPDGSLQSK